MNDLCFLTWEHSAMLARLSRTILFPAAVVAASLSVGQAVAETALVPAQDTAIPLGGDRAQGAVIWSHGRSLQTECLRTPTPEYVDAFRAAGWDTFRLNRPRVADTLLESGTALAEAADTLKHRGYRRIVLAGQSFGAFISLIAAARSDAVDAVIGTAPAAYGSAESNPAGFAQNATELYELLGAVRHARVALFFFEADVFDPGGRGPVADQILIAHGLTHLIVDKPAGLPTHWAAAGKAFATQYASCLLAFAGTNLPTGALDCRAVGAPAHIAGMAGPPPAAALPQLTSLPHHKSMSVIDLEIGRREDVNTSLGRR